MLKTFILYNHPLFARGLERLLEQVGDVQVMGVAAKSEEAFTQIRASKPDVVILEAERGGSEAEMFLSRLLREQRRAGVVGLNLDDNTCTAYSGCRCTANSAEDLVKCVLLMAPSLTAGGPQSVKYG